MGASIARVVEITASSDTSFEDAANAAITRARATLRNVQSGWVKDQSIRVDGDSISYQVNLEVTFVLDDADDIG